MLRLSTVTMTLALLLTGCTDTEQLATGLDSGRFEDGPGAGYSRLAWTTAREIPDGNHRGILLGPVLAGDDDAEVGPVVLRLDIRHPRVADLDIWLAYDADGDGQPEARAPVEFFRSRSQVWADELHACPQSVQGTCFFRDGSCTEDAAFAPFDTLPRGGVFYLAVADTLAEDTGSVLGWSVYLERPGSLAQD